MLALEHGVDLGKAYYSANTIKADYLLQYIFDHCLQCLANRICDYLLLYRSTTSLAKSR